MEIQGDLGGYNSSSSCNRSNTLERMMEWWVWWGPSGYRRRRRRVRRVRAIHQISSSGLSISAVRRLRVGENQLYGEKRRSREREDIPIISNNPRRFRQRTDNLRTLFISSISFQGEGTYMKSRTPTTSSQFRLTRRKLSSQP